MQIENALLADYAEVTSRKLYLMGGGWETARAETVPHQLRIGMAISVRVDWDETNVPINVTMRIENDDGAELAKVNGRMQVGRAPDLRPGSSQLAHMAVNMTVQLQEFGGYRVAITATADGLAEDTRVLPFRLTEGTGRRQQG